MRVTVELTGEEIRGILECYRVNGTALGAIRPDLRQDAHAAAALIQGAWEAGVAVAVAEDADHEAHGGDESPRPDECPVCLRAMDIFLRYGESDPTPAPCHVHGCPVGVHSIGRPHPVTVRRATPEEILDKALGL